MSPPRLFLRRLLPALALLLAVYPRPVRRALLGSGGAYTLVQQWAAAAGVVGSVGVHEFGDHHRQTTRGDGGATAERKLKLTGAVRYRGIVAKADVRAGDVLLAVPESLLISPRSYRPSPGDAIGALLVRSMAPPAAPTLRAHAFIALVVLHETIRGDASRWAPYLATLPTPDEMASSVGIPFLDAAARAQLDWYARGSFLRRVASSLEEVQASWHTIRTALIEPHSHLFAQQPSGGSDGHGGGAQTDGGPTRSTDRVAAEDEVAGGGGGELGYTLAGFDWAIRVVLSRVFSVEEAPADGGQRNGDDDGRTLDGEASSATRRTTTALVPIADFFNHAWNKKGKTANGPVEIPGTTTSTAQVRVQYGMHHESKTFQVRANVDVSKGDEVFISYGPHSNSIMVQNYGIVQRDNPYETVSLDLSQFVPFLPDSCPNLVALAAVAAATAAAAPRGTMRLPAWKQREEEDPMCRMKLAWMRDLSFLNTTISTSSSSGGGSGSGEELRRQASRWQMKFHVNGYPHNHREIQTFRFLLISRMDVHRLGGESHVFERLKEGHPITPENELLVHQFVMEGMDRALRLFRTTLSEDLARLGGLGWRDDSELESVRRKAMTAMTVLERRIVVCTVETKRIMHKVLLRSLEAIQNMYRLAAHREEQASKTRSDAGTRRAQVVHGGGEGSGEDGRWDTWRRASRNWQRDWERWWAAVNEGAVWEE